MTSAIKQSAVAQNKKADSLNLLLKKAKQDTIKLRLMVEISEECDPADILKYAKPAVELADAILKSNQVTGQATKHIKSQKASALNNIGYVYNTQGNIKEALDCYEKSLKINDEIGDKPGSASILNNIGYIYSTQGKSKEALDYYERSLKIKEENGDKKGVATSLSNIGLIYKQQGRIQEALDYYSNSLKIREEIGDKNGIGGTLINISVIYKQQGQIKEALANYNKCLKLLEETDDKIDYAICLNNIGIIYQGEGKIKDALSYFERSLKIREDIGSKKGIASSLGNIGSSYTLLGKLEEAQSYQSRCLQLYKKMDDREGIAHAMESIGSILLLQHKTKDAAKYADSTLTVSMQGGYVEDIRNAELLLAKTDSAADNGIGAFMHFKQFIMYRDSINNAQTRKASLQKQIQYEYEKKEIAAKAEQDKIDAINTEEKQKQRVVIYAVAGLLVLFAVFAIFMFNRFRVTNRQKKIIELQKQKVDEAYTKLEEKNKEVIDSIHYAKRIQTALITSEKSIANMLNSLIKNN